MGLTNKRDFVAHYIKPHEDDSNVEIRRTTREIHRSAWNDYGCCLQDGEFTQRTGLPFCYLHSAFQKLPKLRHFEFTDFRALSRNREAFVELCKRLFGETLSPELLPDDEQGDADILDSDR